MEAAFEKIANELASAGPYGVILLAMLIGGVFVWRQIYHSLFRERDHANQHDRGGVVTEYYETGTETMKENARNIATLTHAIESIKNDTSELVRRQCPIVGQIDGGSGIHRGQ